MIKNNKGITLIALVITIIVLLILAGVSIAMLTGDNGILTQAGNARTETAQAEAEEAVKLAVNEILANKLNPNYTNETNQPEENTITKSNLETMVPRNNPNVAVIVDASKVATNYFKVTATCNNASVVLYVHDTTGEVTTTDPSTPGA